MFIDYNAEGTPNKGSCIFLHCTGKNKYTAGCVAIPEKMMKQIICWAREGTKIVIRKKP
jgi:L,D-peptidoglycan transpeptidase YkuD (ErfK/YbiS/YcfS/YnhG family)